MKILPEKNSKKWISILAIYATIVFASLILVQSILHTKLETKSILALVIIAVGTTLFVCIGGFFGAKRYFISSSLGLAIGIVYMIYIAAFNASPGWGDLTSIIGYVFFAAIGMATGIILEIVWIFIKKIKK